MKKIIVTLMLLMLLHTGIFAGSFAEDMATLDGEDWQRFEPQAKTVLMVGIFYGIYYESIASCGFDKYGIGDMQPAEFHAFIQLIELFYLDKDNRDVLIIGVMRFIVEAKA